LVTVGVAVPVKEGVAVKVAGGVIVEVAVRDGVGVIVAVHAVPHRAVLVAVGVAVDVSEGVAVTPIPSTPFVTTRFEIGAAIPLAVTPSTIGWLKVSVATPFASVCNTIVASTPDPVGPCPAGAPSRVVAFTPTDPLVLSIVHPGRSKVEPPLVAVQLLKNVPSVTDVIDTRVGSKLRPNCVPMTGTSLETITLSVMSCPARTVAVGMAIDNVPFPGTVLGVGLATTTVVVGIGVKVEAAVKVAPTIVVGDCVAVDDTVGVVVAAA
jgi:hypothetical protein